LARPGEIVEGTSAIILAAALWGDVDGFADRFSANGCNRTCLLLVSNFISIRVYMMMENTSLLTI